MKKFFDEYLNSTVVCPRCKQKRKGGEMISSICMCKYCYEKDKGGEEE